MAYLIRENGTGRVDGYYASLEEAREMMKYCAKLAGHQDFTLLKAVEDHPNKPKTLLEPWLADAYPAEAKG